MAVLLTDEGLNGLSVHLVNDRRHRRVGRLVWSLFSGEHCLETAERGVAVPARGGTTVSSSSLFDGFRDVTYAYRFGPRHHELVVARLLDEEGSVLSRATYLPAGRVGPCSPRSGFRRASN